MSKSPKDTKGPVVKSGPTKGQNRSRNSDGKWRAKRSDTGATRVKINSIDKPENPYSRDLSRWFWGAIIVMAILSILLTVIAGRNLGDDTDLSSTAKSEGRINPSAVVELSGSEFSQQLNEVSDVALGRVMSEVGPLLDAAYLPVYAAIPVYAEFHYSVLGEYAELTEAAFGNVAGKLQQTLFSGLEARLESVSTELDEIFNLAFEQELKTSLSAQGAADIDIGPVTRQAVQDAVNRMWVTAPVGTAAAFGTGAGSKIAATTVAKQISTKLAVKAIAKTGGKWAAAGTAAGTGAALCSWAGPGAGVCAAAGGVGAWVAVDYGIIKIDQARNRDDFEADLEYMIDQIKADHKHALKHAVGARTIALSEVFEEIAQQQDFTLRELSGTPNPETCSLARDFIEKYEPMRDNLRARTPEAIRALQGVISSHTGNVSLGPLVREIQQNIQYASQVTLVNAQIIGNLPTEHRSDRDVSIQFSLNGKPFETTQTPASSTDGFSVAFEIHERLRADQAVGYAVAIEQHLRFWRSRYFGGSGEEILIDQIADQDGGLEHDISVEFLLATDLEASAIEDVSIISQEGQSITLALQIGAEPLAELVSVPVCR